jgi:hypothetical protein
MAHRIGDDATLTYSVEHEAWHWPANRATGTRPTVFVTADTGGGCEWQFTVTVTEHEQDQRRPIRVEVFDEAFAAFRDIPDFFAALDAMPAMTLADVVRILRRMDATDITEREIPARLATHDKRYRVR